MTRNRNALIAAMAVGTAALGMLIAPAAALAQGTGTGTGTPAAKQPTANKPMDGAKQPMDGQGTGKDGAMAKSGAKVGEMAPAFTLTDTDGKSHKLADLKGKIVVLEWFNPECPFVVKHHDSNKTFNDLHAQYNGKNVVFMAVNSSAAGLQGYGKDVNAQARKDWAIPYPVLLDEDGTVGRLYGAKTTPHVYIIGADGKLAYNGAICNNKDAKKVGDKNYAKMALDEIIAGKPVTEATTQPYGCSVKYAAK